jgi:hypothetical protein
MGPCSYRYMCMRIPIASEPYSGVKPAGANRPSTTSALWRYGARLAGEFPRPGKGKHCGATLGRSYNGPPCARETPLARSLSQLHCAGLYVRGGAAHIRFQSLSTKSDRRPTSSRTSTHDPRVFFAALDQKCAARYGTQLGGHCRTCPSAAWGNAEFCTSGVQRIPYFDYTGSMSCAVYGCRPCATVHKVLYYPYDWC